jgi:hypothetical protein
MFRKVLVLTMALTASTSCFALIYDDELDLIQRGDANSDGTVDVSDMSTITGWLFLGEAAPPCLNQADVNNDGQVTVSDSISIASWLYGGGTPPEAPDFPFGSGSCGVDSNPVGCSTSPCS